MSLHARQVALLEGMRQKMLAIKDQDPQWFAKYEDSDPITAPRETLEMLLDEAPSDYACGLITGIMAFRQQLAIITDRSF